MTPAMVRELSALKTHDFVLVRPSEISMHRVYMKLVRLGFATAETNFIPEGYTTSYTRFTLNK